MRRVLMAALSAIILAVLTITAVTLTSAPDSNAPAVLLPTPSATPALPACVTEDGAGQALCWWDAQHQGNGKGTSMISGDCALSVTGSTETQDVCLNLHAQDSRETVLEDGATNTIPNGADLVQECNDEQFNEAGSSLIECYRAWL